MTETAPADPQPASTRRRMLAVAGVAIVLCAIACALWWLLIGSGQLTTDDAHVGGDTAQITPLISAPVRAVLKSDTDAVKAGDVLVVLDDPGARNQLDRAEAALDRAIRRVRGYDASNRLFEAQIAARIADVTWAETQVRQARSAPLKGQSDPAHRATRIDRGAEAGEDVTAARNAEAKAKANLASTRAALAQAHANQTAAQASLAANRALTSGTAAADNPDVAAARAKRDQARVDASRALLRAPFAGVIARRQVQVGQRVAAGATLMTVVPVEHLYVDANFKEAQLRTIKPGQTAKLTSDTYGGSVTFYGRVIGRGAGTGSAFALIPAQNATGNRIKVVQRIPVRIRLDPAELRANPLAIGTSMTVTVNLGH